MRRREVRAKGIDDGLLQRALRRRVVSSPDGRYSLNDVDAIRAFGGAAGATPEPAGPVRRQSGFVTKPFVWNVELEEAWVRRGAHPAELPDGYFQVPGEPRLVTPANVFQYTVHGPVPTRPTARYVRRSAGYELRDGRLRWFDQDDRFAVLEEGEPMQPEWVTSNRDFLHAVDEMKRETYRRQSAQTGRRDLSH
jgi:hypothetical protein